MQSQSLKTALSAPRFVGSSIDGSTAAATGSSSDGRSVAAAGSSTVGSSVAAVGSRIDSSIAAASGSSIDGSSVAAVGSSIDRRSNAAAVGSADAGAGATPPQGDKVTFAIFDLENEIAQTIVCTHGLVGFGSICASVCSLKCDADAKNSRVAKTIGCLWRSWP